MQYELSQSSQNIHADFFKRFDLFIFRERGREGEREVEKHRCERETLIGHLLHMPRKDGKCLSPSYN